MSSNFWFWTHFILVTLSHFLVGVLVITTIRNFYTSDAKILDRLRRIAIVFFIAVFGVNHITSSNSQCILTTLESKARIKEGKNPVNDFLPRYYDKIAGLL